MRGREHKIAVKVATDGHVEIEIPTRASAPSRVQPLLFVIE